MENFEDLYEVNGSDGTGDVPVEGIPSAPEFFNSPEPRPVYSAPRYDMPPVPPMQEKKPAKKRHPVLRSAVSLVLAAALVAAGCGFTYTAVDSKWEAQARSDAAAIELLSARVDELQKQLSGADHVIVSPTASPASAPAADGTLLPRDVYALYADCVVSISSTVQATVYGQVTQGTSSGSGFIISSDGYVVTNYHVIEGAIEVEVILGNEERYTAKIVGSDSINDVAVLKIEATDLPAVVLGNSDDLMIGDMVVAIGNPLGSLTATLTVGYVSGKNREITTDRNSINMIQADVAINSGNSGGPLFNMKGEVVGITSAKYSGTTSSGASIEGISFSIPINDVMGIIGDLRDLGYVTGAYLGVTVQDTDAASAKLYGLPTGAYVVTTVEGGSADRAGVQPKDIIIALGNHDVSSVSELTRALRRFKSGDTTTITVIRSGERITMDITLDEKPQDLNSVPSTAPSDSNMPQDGSYDEWYKYFFGEDGTDQGSSNGENKRGK